MRPRGRIFFASVGSGMASLALVINPSIHPCHPVDGPTSSAAPSALAAADTLLTCRPVSRESSSLLLLPLMLLSDGTSPSCPAVAASRLRYGGEPPRWCCIGSLCNIPLAPCRCCRCADAEPYPWQPRQTPRSPLLPHRLPDTKPSPTVRAFGCDNGGDNNDKYELRRSS